MIEVLPAIIPESYEDLSCKMSEVKGIVKLVQIDFCDGKFVPSKSWPFVGDDENHFESIARETARTVLPLSNYTELYWKQDLKNLFH